MGFFDSAYAGTPPWDIGRPQPEFVRLEREGEIVGVSLDVGCGTGELVLYLANHGHEAWGLDGSPTALAKARAKAKDRGVEARFVEGDALALGALGRTFDTVTDSGLFHTLSDEERAKYVGSLRRVLRLGGQYVMLCFSEHEPTSWGGPRRVRQDEIQSTFQAHWQIRYIREARFETRMPEVSGFAWLSSITRLE